MLRQLSYAIKNQLKAPKAPYQGLWDESSLLGAFLPFAGSLWHKDKKPLLGRSRHQVENTERNVAIITMKCSIPFSYIQSLLQYLKQTSALQVRDSNVADTGSLMLEENAPDQMDGTK